MANSNVNTYMLQTEGVAVEVVTETDDLDFLNVILPMLNQNQNNISPNQVRLVKRDDGVIEIHGIHLPIQNQNSLENNIQDDFGDDSSSAIENQEQVYLEVDATPESLDRDDLSSKRENRLERDIHRKRLARARETEEQKVQRLEKDRKRKQEARKHESEEQRAARLAKDRARVYRRRMLETEIQRLLRLERNRDVKRRSRMRDQTRVEINNNNNTTHHLQPFSANNIKEEIVSTIPQLSSHNQAITKPIATDILTIVSL